MTLVTEMPSVQSRSSDCLELRLGNGFGALNQSHELPFRCRPRACQDFAADGTYIVEFSPAGVQTDDGEADVPQHSDALQLRTACNRR